MTTVTTTVPVSIKADPATVFKYVSDLTKHPEWSGGQLTIEPLAAGPVAVGSRYHSKGEVATQKDRPNELRVTELVPPDRFTFVASDPDFGDVTHVFTFKPQAGGTLMERTVIMNLPALRRLVFRMVVWPLVGRPMMNKAFAALKTKLES
jgi:uncharacterized protein YndB with AHSA1/START domain